MGSERLPLDRIDRIDEKLRREKSSARRTKLTVGSIVVTFLTVPVVAQVAWGHGGLAFLGCFLVFLVGLIVKVSRDNARRGRQAEAATFDVIADGAGVPRGSVRYVLPLARPCGSMSLPVQTESHGPRNALLNEGGER